MKISTELLKQNAETALREGHSVPYVLIMNELQRRLSSEDFDEFVHTLEAPREFKTKVIGLCVAVLALIVIVIILV